MLLATWQVWNTLFWCLHQANKGFPLCFFFQLTAMINHLHTVSTYMKQLVSFEFDFFHFYACIRSLEHIVLVHYRETQEVCFLYLGNFLNTYHLWKKILLQNISMSARSSFLLSLFRLPVQITYYSFMHFFILGYIPAISLALLFHT